MVFSCCPGRPYRYSNLGGCLELHYGPPHNVLVSPSIFNLVLNSAILLPTSQSPTHQLWDLTRNTMARIREEKRLPVLSRNEIEHLIANGRNIVIVDGKVLKCDAWMPYHPGGDQAIRHMVGRDATDEINAYEPWVLHSGH